MTGSPEPLVSVRHHLQTFLTLKNATYPIFEICFRVFFLEDARYPVKMYMWGKQTICTFQTYFTLIWVKYCFFMQISMEMTYIVFIFTVQNLNTVPDLDKERP